VLLAGPGFIIKRLYFIKGCVRLFIFIYSEKLGISSTVRTQFCLYFLLLVPGTASDPLYSFL
jgi:hypothetical protein